MDILTEASSCRDVSEPVTEAAVEAFLRAAAVEDADGWLPTGIIDMRALVEQVLLRRQPLVVG